MQTFLDTLELAKEKQIAKLMSPALPWDSLAREHAGLISQVGARSARV